jgi:hypothetical protein
VASSDALVQISSLKLMLDKKLISQEEYDSAMRDISASSGSKAGSDTNTLVLGKFATTIYGFVEADAIHDSTENLNDLQGNALIARNETFAGQHGQLLGTIRNSRFGIRLKAPEFHGVRVSGMIEMDFIGSPAGIGYPAANGQASEAATFSNAVVRERHINVKVETPIVDFLFGQWWALFGWQPYFHINTVDFQGVPTELYSRRPQFRISKTIKTDPINIETAIAALDPVQKASETPEMQAGVRVVINKWKGKLTHGSTGTAIEPASIGVSGDMKYVKLPTPLSSTVAPNNTADLVGTAIAVNAFLPIIPTSDAGKSGNNLSITAEFATGYGVADQYTGLTGGVTLPGSGTPANYPQNIDNGIATLDASNNPHFIQWYTTLVGVQYYFPIKDGKIWITANYGHEESPNSAQFMGASKHVRTSLDWVNADFFAEPVPGFRVGLSYGRTWDNYEDKQQANNDRVMGSAFFIF